MSHLRDRRREGGFTLIEVLLVLVILVVLASFAVVNVLRVGASARVKAARSQIGMFKTPLEAFALDVGMYPTTAHGLQALCFMPPDVPPNKWLGPYLSTEVPLDPWDQPYQYMSPGQRNFDTYDVWTTSPQGEVIGNWPEGT
jgi:general secretion pathway protein G